jgi:hypothetical protein
MINVPRQAAHLPLRALVVVARVGVEAPAKQVPRDLGLPPRHRRAEGREVHPSLASLLARVLSARLKMMQPMQTADNISPVCSEAHYRCGWRSWDRSQSQLTEIPLRFDMFAIPLSPPAPVIYRPARGV